MVYYKYKDKYLCALDDVYDYEKIAHIDEAAELYYLYRSARTHSKKSYALTHIADLFAPEESLAMLRESGQWKAESGKRKGESGKEEIESGQWKAESRKEERKEVEIREIEVLRGLMEAGRVKAVNTAYADYEDCFFMEEVRKKTVHLLALGDVGSNVLIGLKLLGGNAIDTIGIYDRSPDKQQRWEYEMNQTSEPFDFESMPTITMIGKDQLFDCDMFVFCASKGVPPVGAEGIDIRMVQFEENAKLIREYAVMAAEKDFKGIFAVVSDPVDLLCRVVLQESGGKLAPEQIKGYGLGVMNARAAYYAKKYSQYAQYLTEGRAYGPHGKDLIIADSIVNYNEELSLELTKLAAEANLEVRKTGFKPYVAPALSSAAIPIVATLEGKWHYSANYLAGAYLGAKNRNLPAGLQIERIPMDNKLFARIEQTHNRLKEQG